MGFFSRLNHKRGRPFLDFFLVVMKKARDPWTTGQHRRENNNRRGSYGHYRVHYAASPQERPVSTSTIEGTSSLTAVAIT
jgi:hypothetical protein